MSPGTRATVNDAVVRRVPSFSRRQRIAGASLLIVGGLGSTYLQMLRSPNAYATACTAAVDEVSLSAALSAVAAGTCDTIDITSDITLTGDLRRVVINAGGTTAMVINGNGHTINAGDGTVSGGHRGFTIRMDRSDSLTMSDLSITGASGDYSGGAALTVFGGGNIRYALTSNGASVDLSGMTFSHDNNDSRYQYGAVFASAVAMTVSDSIFSYNTSEGASGACIMNDFYASLEITDSTFTHCVNTQPGNTGGAVSAGGPATVTGSTFTDNSAGDRGGAISSNSGLKVSDSVFIDNSAGGRGGAIATAVRGMVEISDTTFRGNSAVYTGGAISANGTLDLHEVSFYDNSTTNASGQGGGALSVNSTSKVVSMTNVFVGGNSAANGPGGMFVYAYYDNSAVQIEFSTFADNVSSDATDPQNIQFYNNAYYTLDSVSLTGVAVTGSGGANCAFENFTGTFTDDYSVSSDASCGLTGDDSQESVVVGLGAYGEDGAHTPGSGSRVPTALSVLMTGAPSSDLGTGVTTDQLGVVRSGKWTIGSRQVAFVGTAPAFTMSSPSGSGRVGSVFPSYTFRASGSTPVTFTKASGTLPPGLTLSSGGVLSGTPSRVGSYTFQVQAANGTAPNATSGSITVRIVAAGVAPVFTKASPPSGKVGSVLSFAFRASGSTPVTFTKASGKLPPGLTLSVGGVLSGTPSTAGSYTFQVQAANGTLPNATTGSITMNVAGRPGAPSKVTGVGRFRSVQVSWEAPISAGGAPITRYAVTAAPGGASCQAQGSGRSCRVTGLSAGKEYSFTVVATNSVGAGARSSASRKVAALDLAGTVRDLVVANVTSDGRVTLSWRAPASDGGAAITLYRVKYGKAGEEADDFMAYGDVKGTTAEVTGLPSGKYFFSVRGLTAAGVGPFAVTPKAAKIP